MAFTETTTTGYGKRVSNSFKGIVTGFLLFLGGTALLFWNEGSFVKKQKALHEGQRDVTTITDVNKIDPQLNGKLIHATGLADTKDSLRDELFGVKELALALDRKVEYYQWVEKSKSEKKDKIGGSQENVTTYTYQQEWTNKPVNSAEFKDPAYRDKNFVLSKIEDKYIMSQSATLGAYKLPDYMISAVKTDQPVTIKLSKEQLVQMESALMKNLGRNYISPSSNISTNLIHIDNNVAYIGSSSARPEVGDVRVTITKSIPSTISIIAKANGNTFEHYYAKNGENISNVTVGTVSAENMFMTAHSSNSTITWLVRLGGLIAVILGLKAMFGIVETLFKFIPMLSNVVGAGVGFVVTLVGLIWALLIVSVSWLFYRPFIAGVLVLAIIAVILLLKKRAKPRELDLSTANV